LPQSRSPATMLAFLFFLLMLTALGVRFWASNQEYEFTGPTHVAADGEHVFLHAAGDLYQLTESGQIVRLLPTELTGLNDTPIDLRLLAGGTLLVAGQRPATIRLCQVEPWQCRREHAESLSILKRQFKVLPDGSEKELLITDAPGDTLWRFSENREPQKLLPDRALAGPNDLAFDATGNLWIADTDHRRIVELEPMDDGAYQLGREHSAENSLTIGERYYPMSLVRAPDDRWWVIQAADFSKALADVVVYDPDEGAQAVIDLPEGAYPTDIVSLGETMVVTDLEQYTVYQVDSGTLAVSEFGGDDFRERLKEIRESRKRLRNLGTGALAAIVLFAVLMLLAAIQATPKKKRWTEPPGLLDIENAAEQVPKTRGIHWLQRNPAFDRSLNWLEWLYGFSFFGYVAGSVVLYAYLRSQAGPDSGEQLTEKLDQMGMFLMLGGLVLAMLYPVVRMRIISLKQKLGTDGNYLYFKLTDGRELSVEPASLFYTKQAILYRNYIIPLLGLKQQSIYRSGEAETWLAPLLRQARKLTPMEALKHRWNNREGVLLWSLAAGGILMFVMVVLETVFP